MRQKPKSNLYPTLPQNHKLKTSFFYPTILFTTLPKWLPFPGPTFQSHKWILAELFTAFLFKWEVLWAEISQYLARSRKFERMEPSDWLRWVVWMRFGLKWHHVVSKSGYHRLIISSQIQAMFQAISINFWLILWPQTRQAGVKTTKMAQRHNRKQHHFQYRCHKTPQKTMLFSQRKQCCLLYWCHKTPQEMTSFLVIKTKHKIPQDTTKKKQ